MSVSFRHSLSAKTVGASITASLVRAGFALFAGRSDMPGATLRQRRLASELRRLREQCGLNIEQAASRVEISKSALSRIENALVTVRLPVLRALVSAYAVESEQAEMLLQLARDAMRREWWQSFGDIASDVFYAYIGFESAASQLLEFGLEMLPGLLQTPEYAASILKGIVPAQFMPNLERSVELRMTRQKRLDAVKYWAIVDEGALRRAICPPACMIEQLTYVAEMSQRPNITIQVIPREIPVHVGLEGSFSLLKFEDPRDPDIVYSESIGGHQLIDDANVTKRAVTIFDHLRATALDVSASRNRIMHIAQEITKGVKQ